MVLCRITHLGAACLLIACSGQSAEVDRIGTLQNPRIVECSGVIASRQYTNTFWVHNDGGRAVLFAITRDGQRIGDFMITGANLQDWEDIAMDETNNLYIADIGNNNRNRAEVAVYQVPEPDLKMPGKILLPKKKWRLRFPDKPFDSEALLIWQTNGYLVSKVTDDKKAELYQFSLADQKEPATLEFITKLNIESPVTGGDISPDGRLLGIVAKSGAFIFEIAGDVATAGRVKRTHLKFKHNSIEGCCFLPEGLLATAESKEIFLYSRDAFGQ